MDSNAPFLHVVTTSLPKNMSATLKQLCDSSTNQSLLENLIRFICGAGCTSSSGLEDGWVEKQAIFCSRLAELNTNKRHREDDEGQGSKKRAKTMLADDNTEPPQFTLHAISTTSPVRKKVDIAIHKSIIKLYHPTSHALEATVPLSSLRRGFLVPTRGKSKPHWTIIIISSDIPDKEKGKAAAASSQENQQIIFGLDAVAMSPVSTTDENGTTLSIKKGEETLPTIRLFLSHLEFPVYEPSVEVFKSALPGNIPEGVPGVEAYRGAKAGNLWFMPEGILWGESKPCEFWAVEDLINKDEGLRMMSATGRTLTLIVMRKSPENELEKDEDMGEESQFSLIDGKEQDGINRWIKKYRHLFGDEGGTANKPISNSETTKATSATTAGLLVSGPMTINQMSMDSDDEDGDFTVKSDNESGGSGSSDEDDGDGGGEDGDDDNSEEAEADGSGEDEENEDREEEEPRFAPNSPIHTHSRDPASIRLANRSPRRPRRPVPPTRFDRVCDRKFVIRLAAF